jgi:hypothetical protein
MAKTGVLKQIAKSFAYLCFTDQKSLNHSGEMNRDHD